MLSKLHRSLCSISALRQKVAPPIQQYNNTLVLKQERRKGPLDSPTQMLPKLRGRAQCALSHAKGKAYHKARRGAGKAKEWLNPKTLGAKVKSMCRSTAKAV